MYPNISKIVHRNRSPLYNRDSRGLDQGHFIRVDNPFAFYPLVGDGPLDNHYSLNFTNNYLLVLDDLVLQKHVKFA